MSENTALSLDMFCRLDRLGLTAVGLDVQPDHSIVICVPTTPAGLCPDCGGVGRRHDRVVRRIAHVPYGWKPTILKILVPRYRCFDCRRVWRHDVSAAAPSRSKLSRDAITYAVKLLVIDRCSVAVAARAIGVRWNTANTAILRAGQEMLISQAGRLDGVTTIGVDEHCWRHTAEGSRFVTVVIDLTPIRENTGTSRLLAVLEGRSKKVFKTWLEDQSEQFRAGVTVVAMDGFTGYKTATVETIAHATTVMDPFHVVALVGSKLDSCRQRVQTEIHQRRGRKGDPLYQVRKTAKTRSSLLTEKQWNRMAPVLLDDKYLGFTVTWEFYQRVIEAYRTTPATEGYQRMDALIDTVKTDVPPDLPELRTLGKTLHQRRDDILAYFSNPGTSNGPTEAINGILEHLRGTARGFRNLTNYIARCLLDAGGFRPLLHSLL